MSARARGSAWGAALAACLTLSGCAAFSDEPVGGRDRTGKLLVVAAFYPLRFMIEQIAGDLVDVETLTQPGQEPHDIELSPRQVGQIATAGLVVYEKGLQASVDEAVDENAAGDVVDAARTAGLEPRDHDGHDDQDHTGLGAAEPGGDLDPHFWLDPLKLGKVADSVREKLSELDPAGAAAFDANYADLEADLTALDASLTQGLADCDRRTVVVSHDAFGYLSRYGLELEPIAGLSPDAEATPADLGRLQALIRSQGITTVFEERLVPAELADSLAGDLGLRTAVLDPIEGLTDDTSGEDYLSLMRENLAALRMANSCR